MFQVNTIVTTKRALDNPLGPRIPQGTAGTIVALRANGAWVEFDDFGETVFVLLGNIEPTGTVKEACALTPQGDQYVAELEVCMLTPAGAEYAAEIERIEGPFSS